MSGTITVPAPKARRGGIVLAENYRKRTRPFVVGEVLSISLHDHPHGWWWRYEVLPLEYRGYRLTVGDDGIKAAGG